MPASLLPPALLSATGRIPLVDEGMATVFPGWPHGHPNARLVEEYLIGRRAGKLDISGRPILAAEPAQADPFTQPDPPTIVLDDPDGALALVAALSSGSEVGLYGDSIAAESTARSAFEALVANGGLPEGKSDVRTVRPPFTDMPAFADQSMEEQTLRVIMTAPKALAAFTEYLQQLVPIAAEVIVVGREKHMSRSFNTELARFFTRVDVSPARAKSRLLIASQPRPADDGPVAHAFPRTAVAPSPGPEVPAIRVFAHGACFGGPRADPGARLLFSSLAEHRAELGAAATAKSGTAGPAGTADPATDRVLDLGCGNGWLLAAIAALLPEWGRFGVDISKAAVASARATCAGAVGPGESTTQPHLHVLDATAALPWPVAPAEFRSGAFDLIALNPPFHAGHQIETDTALTMIARAHQLLAPGGRLVCVFNSNLRYRSHIARLFGNAEQWARDRRFTVVAAQRQGQ